MIVALAGRRVDASDATESRFPPENIGIVKERIRSMFRDQKATTLVCSAACGADLLALEAAQDSEIRRRVVLPFTREEFRRTSVADRPGSWGKSFDRVLDDVQLERDLVLLGYAENDSAAYAATNSAILDEGIIIARTSGLALTAVVVWDCKSRGPDDLTEQFKKEAQRRHLPVLEIPTMD
jgi:hypothetical protein